MSEDRRFYVYVHRKKSDCSPFYVGKGHGRRAWETSEKRRSSHWTNTAKKHGVFVEIYQDGLTEDEAFAVEKRLIAELKSLGANLVNQTDGGEGTSGLKMTEEKKAILRAALVGHKFNLGRKYSPEIRQKMSEGQKRAYELGRRASFEGRTHSPMTKQLLSNKLKGRKFSDETKEKMRQARLGKKLSEDVKEKIREKCSGENNPMYGVRGEAHPGYGLTGAKNTMSKPIRCMDTGQVFESVSLAAKHMRENGYPKAAHQPISSAAGKPNRTAYGYRWELLNDRD
jgi:hypothetical protein